VDLIDLDLVTAVAETGSITHGAARARLSLPSASGAGGFRDTGGCSQVATDVAKPAADPARCQRPGGIGVFLPGAAEVAGQGPGEQELGVRGHEDPDPAVRLFRGSHLGGGEAEGSLRSLKACSMSNLAR
jgi:hypothetical protein